MTLFVNVLRPRSPRETEDVTLAGIRGSLTGPGAGLSCGPVLICFPGQAAEIMRAARNSTDREQRNRCGHEGCRAEAQEADGWIFVGDGGEQRHYCRACLARSLEHLRDGATPNESL